MKAQERDPLKTRELLAPFRKALEKKNFKRNGHSDDNGGTPA